MKFITAALLVLATGASASAQGGEKHAEKSGPVQLRQNYMESLGGHIGSIGTLLKYKMNEPEQIAAHAESIELVSKFILDMFPKGSDKGDTKAKPEIWKDWKDFEKKADAFKSAATKLASAAKSKDMAKIGPAVGDLGKACKGCHKSYEKPDDK